MVDWEKKKKMMKCLHFSFPEVLGAFPVVLFNSDSWSPRLASRACSKISDPTFGGSLVVNQSSGASVTRVHIDDSGKKNVEKLLEYSRRTTKNAMKLETYERRCRKEGNERL